MSERPLVYWYFECKKCNTFWAANEIQKYQDNGMPRAIEVRPGESPCYRCTQSGEEIEKEEYDKRLADLETRVSQTDIQISLDDIISAVSKARSYIYDPESPMIEHGKPTSRIDSEQLVKELAGVLASLTSIKESFAKLSTK